MADVWAAGVVLFVLNSGTVPFYAETPTDLFQLIAEDNIDFESKQFR